MLLLYNVSFATYGAIASLLLFLILCNLTYSKCLDMIQIEVNNIYNKVSTTWIVSQRYYIFKLLAIAPYVTKEML